MLKEMWNTIEGPIDNFFSPQTIIAVSQVKNVSMIEIDPRDHLSQLDSCVG